ncbi:MAG: Fe-S cluster assembly protein SufD [Elusimicrobia bacterium]|nr:Fe-S cluster assembly protein SufD [Elusimicrobiota bacterium]
MNKLFKDTPFFESLLAAGLPVGPLAERPWPTTREEAWRYTDLSGLAQARAHIPRRVEGTLPASVKALLPKDFQGVVLLNGIPVEALSSFEEETNQRTVQLSLSSSGSGSGDLFEAVNRSAGQAEVRVSVAKGADLSVPFYVIHIMNAVGEGALVCPRLVVNLAEGSRLRVVEMFLGHEVKGYVSIPVAELSLADGAGLDYVQVHDHPPVACHVGRVRVDGARDSQASVLTVTNGAAVFRQDLLCDIRGEGSTVSVNGLHALKGLRHADSHTEIRHHEPASRSEQLYKCVLDDEARSVFNGRIVVDQKAQKTNSYQLNKNLLLSPDARVDTKPQLEIHADDVRCTHGATIGRVNEEEIFYLQTRGIGREDARRLLVRAFMDDVISRLEDPGLREILSRKLKESYGF